MSNELQTTQQDSFTAMVQSLAISKDVDPAKLAAVLDIQMRVMEKNAEIAFNQAMSRISSKIPHIKKGGAVSYADKAGVSKEAFTFARFEDIDVAIRPLLIEEGLSLSFSSTERAGGGAVLTGTLSHKDGHSISSSIPLALDTSGGKNNIQAMGSTISYGKRYTTCMLLNIVTTGEDDDGKAGGAVFITEAQQAEIEAMIAETKSDTDKFCNAFGVAYVGNLTPGDYSKALNMLLAKKAKMVKP